MANSKAVLLTGGAGFIGKHLVRRILSSFNKYDVIVVDNLSNSRLDGFVRALSGYGSTTNLSPLSGNEHSETIIEKRLRFYLIDICNRQKMKELFKRETGEIIACIHLAAKVSVAESLLRPHEVIDINVHGTKNVIDCVEGADIKNFVFTSSAAVYGMASKLPIAESDEKKPLSVYGNSKLKGEQIVERYSRKDKEALSLRLFNVYGRGQNSMYAGVITNFANRLRQNLPPIIYGSGHQTRDFVYIEDVVEALLLGAGLTRKKNLTTEIGNHMNKLLEANRLSVPYDMKERDSAIFNIGTGIPTSINDLAIKMRRVFNRNMSQSITAAYRDPIEGDICPRFLLLTLSYQNYWRLSNILSKQSYKYRIFSFVIVCCERVLH